MKVPQVKQINAYVSPGPGRNINLFTALASTFFTILTTLESALADVPVGFVSSYEPNEPNRETIVEIKRAQAKIKLNQVPVYIETGDSIQLKHQNAAVTLSFGNGELRRVTYTDSPFIVQAIDARPDWKDLFWGRPVRSKETQTITSSTDLKFDAIMSYTPFKVVHAPGNLYPGATLSMFPLVWQIPQDLNGNPAIPIFPGRKLEDGLVLDRDREAKFAFSVMSTADDANVEWSGGTPPFTLEFFTPNGTRLTVTKPKYDLYDKAINGFPSDVDSPPSAFVNIKRPWLNSGWAKITVSDAKGQRLKSDVLVVDLEELTKCPFARDPRSKLDAAIVCSGWRGLVQPKPPMSSGPAK